MKTVIFDFDGTIALTMYQVLEIVNNLAKRNGYPAISIQEAKDLRNESVREIFRILKVPWWKLPLVVNAIRKEMKSRILEAKMEPGMKEVFMDLKKRGYRLGVVSSNSKDVIMGFLKKNSLLDFDFIYSGSSAFGKGRVLRSLLRTHHVEGKEAIYVGDEIRDIEAAKEAGLRIISVTWGYNSRKALESRNSENIVDKPEQLLGLLS